MVRAARAAGGGRAQEQVDSCPPGLTWEPPAELLDSVSTWTALYEQLSTDRRRAAWFMNGSSKVARQRAV